MAACMSTRRRLLGAIAVTPAVLTVPAMAMPYPDAEIETAWRSRQAAYATYNALPVDNQPVVDGYGPGEREL